jgi:lipoic acid synthetase
VTLPDFLINPIRKHRFQLGDLPRPVNTVCELAKCPNRGECFTQKTVTFLLLGNTCTRNCKFCGIVHSPQGHTPKDEIEAILETINHFGLQYVVLTSVTRDDLADGGASHFVAVMEAIRRAQPAVKIEILVPDFQGDENALNTVGNAHPTVFNHNLEMVPKLFPSIRPEGSFQRSVNVLAHISRLYPSQKLKTGIMVGLGETPAEVDDLIRFVATIPVHILTIGQYLAPSKKAWPVDRIVDPAEYEHYKELGQTLGLEVFAGPLVRSSYHAEAVVNLSTGG